jgi:hypothetical protein
MPSPILISLSAFGAAEVRGELRVDAEAELDAIAADALAPLEESAAPWRAVRRAIARSLS